MAYHVVNRRSELNVKQDDLLASKRYLIERKPETIQFYELEAAVVLDVILNEDHPEFSEKILDPVDWPVDASGNPAKDGQPNYGWIGMIKFRFLNSQAGDEKDILHWALPIENTGITEYPLMNEVVIVGKYLDTYYYNRKLNLKSMVNANASFELERTYGTYKNINEYTGVDYTGPISKLNGEENDDQLNPNYVGVLGEYFKFNPAIRALKRYEGDSIIESRFGQSIRFGSYDETRENDNGIGEYSDNGGNPMLLIRNRQAPIKGTSELTKLVNKGYVTESINNDGSSIHLTSGKTISSFISTVKKPMVSGVSMAPAVTLTGDQIVVNSDRIVLSAKVNEMLHFSKKRMSFVTDNEITVDAKKKITITTDEVVSINSPEIYLGRHNEQFQPTLLGRDSVAWINALCGWMLANLDSQIAILKQQIEFAKSHMHLGNMGRPTSNPMVLPPTPMIIATLTAQLALLVKSRADLFILADQLNSLMSNRVFGS